VTSVSVSFHFILQGKLKRNADFIRVWGVYWVTGRDEGDMISIPKSPRG